MFCTHSIVDFTQMDNIAINIRQSTLLKIKKLHLSFTSVFRDPAIALQIVVRHMPFALIYLECLES